MKYNKKARKNHFKKWKSGASAVPLGSTHTLALLLLLSLFLHPPLYKPVIKFCKYNGLLNMAQSPIGWFVVKDNLVPRRAPLQTSYRKRLLIRKFISLLAATSQISGTWGGHICRTKQTCIYRLTLLPHVALQEETLGSRNLFRLSGVMVRSPRFMPRTQRRPVGVRDLLCRWHTELIFYDAHVSAAWSASLLNALNLSSVTFCVAALLPPLHYTDREDCKEEKMSLEVPRVLSCTYI